MGGLLGLVEELDELGDAASIDIKVRLPVGSLIFEVDDQAGVEERKLTEAACDDVKAELGRAEDLRIGLEGELGARLVRLPDGAERLPWHAPIVLLDPDLALASDLEAKPL